MGPWQIGILFGAILVILFVAYVLRNAKRKGQFEEMQRQERIKREEPPKETSSSARFRELEKLRHLRDDGTLTQEEFEREKARILNN